MPRHIYWTIVMAEGPTAFRARDAQDLLPTLKQLQTRHPDAVMKWFERGQLWDSPEAARLRPLRRPVRPRAPDAARFGRSHGRESGKAGRGSGPSYGRPARRAHGRGRGPGRGSDSK